MATGITLVVVLVAKFMSGAWVTAILVPLLISLMMRSQAALHAGTAEMADPTPLRADRSGAADCGDPDGALGQDHGEGAAVRAAAVARRSRWCMSTRTTGRRRGLDGCGKTMVLKPIAGTGTAGAGAGDDSVELTGL